MMNTTKQPVIDWDAFRNAMKIAQEDAQKMLRTFIGQPVTDPIVAKE